MYAHAPACSSVRVAARPPFWSLFILALLLTFSGVARATEATLPIYVNRVYASSALTVQPVTSAWREMSATSATIPTFGTPTVILTVQTAAAMARNFSPDEPMRRHTTQIALGLLLLPLAGIKRVRKRIPRILAIVLFAALGLGAAAGLGRCAGNGSILADIASHSVIKVTAISGSEHSSVYVILNVE